MPGSTELLVLAVPLVLATVGLVLAVRYADQRDRDGERVVYRLEFPHGVKTEQVVAFLRSLAGLRPARGWLLGVDTAVLEVLVWKGAVEHRLRLPKRRAEALVAQARTAVPGLHVVLLDKPAVTWANAGWELGLSDPSRPLRTDHPEAVTASLLTALTAGPIYEGELVTWAWTVWAASTGQPTPAHPRQSATDLLKQIAGTTPPAPDKQDRAARRQKLTEPVFAVVGRVGAGSATRGRSGQLVEPVAAVVHQLAAPGVRLTTRPLAPHQAAARIASAATPIGVPPARLNARELACLIGWPIGDNLLVPGLRLAGNRPLPPAAELPSTGRVVGTSTWPGTERPIAISPADSCMHMLVTGPTGTGKSTLLLNLILQDIRAGRGVVVLDPGGDLVVDLLDRIPAERTGDVILLDPSDTARPVPLQVLAASNPDEAELAADQLLSLIAERSDSWGPRLEEVMRAALVALAAHPELTLAELEPLLTDAAFRAGVVGALDPVTRSTIGAVFARLDAWSDGERQQAVAAVMNKLTPIIGRRQLRAMVGQTEPTWTMRQVLDQAKVLLVRLPSGLIGNYAADLLAGTVLAMVWNAIQARASQARTSRRMSFIYVDEAPRLIRGGLSVTDFLARARQHSAGIVAVAQHIKQFPTQVREAMLSEARSKIAFQPGAEDATILARQFGPLVTATDLQTLPPRTAMAALVVGGSVVAPTTIATAPPPPPTGVGQRVREASRHTYGRNRTEVEQAIQARRRPPDSGPRRTRRLP
jgi:hypothetical protein